MYGQLVKEWIFERRHSHLVVERETINEHSGGGGGGNRHLYNESIGS